MAFKMKGNPMHRNYGIGSPNKMKDLSGDGKVTKKDVLIGRGVINKDGSPMNKNGDPKKASKVVETKKPEEAPQYLTPRGHMGQPDGLNIEARTQEMEKAFDEKYDNLDKKSKNKVKDIQKGIKKNKQKR